MLFARLLLLLGFSFQIFFSWLTCLEGGYILDLTGSHSYFGVSIPSYLTAAGITFLFISF
jgi:hypothetical protein